MSARIEEIRTENHHGEVSSDDIEWLCQVADLAERIADPTPADVHHFGVGTGVAIPPHLFRSLRKAFGVST